MNFFLILIPIIFLLFFQFGTKFAKKIKLVDNKNIPLIGGIFLYIGFVVNFFYLNDDNKINEYLIDLYFLSSIFLISLLDDRYKLRPSTRLLLIVFLLILFIDKNNLTISNLNFETFGFYYFSEIKIAKYLFPVFCLIVLINAYNFTDGINGLASLIGASWFIYLFLNFPFLNDLYKIFLIFIILFLVLNFLNKSYLGDSGNYLISIIIGFIIISLNQKMPYSIYVEEILLLFLIPGLDLIRLFFKRLINKKNPLQGDLDHFHHILISRFNLKKTLIIYLGLINIPLYIYYFLQSNIIFLLILSTLAYMYLVKKLSK